MEFFILEKNIGGRFRYEGTRWNRVSSDLRPIDKFIDRCTNYALYGGDPDGTPEQYKRIDLNNPDAICELHIVPVQACTSVDMLLATKVHNDAVTANQLKELEKSERAELTRLLAKYGRSGEQELFQGKPVT